MKCHQRYGSYLSIVGMALAMSACQPPPTELTLNLESGAARSVTTKTESMMTIDSEQGTIVVESARTADLTFTLTNISEDGAHTFDVAIDDVKLDMSTRMGEQDVAAQFGISDMFKRGMDAVVGESFQIIVDSKGIVNQLEGADPIREMAVDAMEIPEGMRDKIDGDRIMGEPAIRDLIRPIFCRFPAEPVRQNEEWVIEESLTTPVQAQITRTWTLEPENGEPGRTFSYNTKVETVEDAEARVVGGMSGEVHLNGTGEGTARVDPETGWLLERNESIAMSGTIAFKLIPSLPPNSVAANLNVHMSAKTKE